jgi:NADP-dependent aldehyde dehydrogenase
VFVPDSDAGDALLAAIGEQLLLAPSQMLLTEHMTAAFDDHVARGELDGKSILRGCAAVGETDPVVVTVDLDQFLERHDYFLDECFGPFAVVVRYRDDRDLSVALAQVEGSLTATLHIEDSADIAALVEQLSARAGRVIFNSWPTGVAIAWGQHHGGPWPATTSSIHTSVGATAIRRFLTPIAYQDCPPALLPEELTDGSTVPRRIDGEMVSPSRLRA